MHDLVEKSDITKNNETKLRVQIETIDRFYPDAKSLFEADWKETTSDGIEFDIDEEYYRELEKQGSLIIFAARYGDKLAGYANFIASRSAHHKKDIASCAGFYVSPQYRGRTGSYLLNYALGMLKVLKMDKVRVSSPAQNDIGKFLGRFGFKPEETIHGLMLR